MTNDRAQTHRLRRLSQLVRHPRHMFRLQQMLRSESPTGYSLQQFETTRSIFIHIPKASGVSVAQSLYGNMGCGHLAMREYELAFGPRFIRDSFIFTFVRNPWDRLHSAYRFLVKGGMNRADARWSTAHRQSLRSFEAFVIEGLRVPAIAESIHIVPQTQFLSSPVYGYDAIDFIGLFENLDHDFRIVCDAIGATGATLSHENRTSGAKEDYRRAFTDPMREAAAAFYHKDIELLGYDFEGLALDQQLAARSGQWFEKSEQPGRNPGFENG